MTKASAREPPRRVLVPALHLWRYNAAMMVAGRSRCAAAPGRRALAALLGVVLCAVPAACAAAAEARAALPAERRPVCIRGVCFAAEIAVTAAERSRGLMHRAELAKDHGMLFVFPDEGRHSFWMKNTLIELDIIFIAADRQVVGISRRAQPCLKEPCDHYAPEGDVAYALEIGGGLATAYGFAAGDLVEFRPSAASP